MATDSAGGSVALSALAVTGVGAPPRIEIQPPEGGWSAGLTYTVAVGGYPYAYEETPEPPAELVFVAGETNAPAAGPFVTEELSIGDWSEETDYAWGCCHPVRAVELDVSVPDADPWSRLEIVGAFDLGRPSQITTDEIHTHLDVAVGPGEHTLAFTQWLDERGPQPPCFDVVAVSAAGERGSRETFCTDEDGIVGDGALASALGCSTAGGGVPWLVTILSLLSLRVVGARSRRS